MRKNMTKDEIADEGALHNFVAQMREKLKQKRAEGRGGWWKHKGKVDGCSNRFLQISLQAHVDRALQDPRQLVDVANLAMFLHERHCNRIEKIGD